MVGGGATGAEGKAFFPCSSAGGTSSTTVVVVLLVVVVVVIDLVVLIDGFDMIRTLTRTSNDMVRDQI